jgi:two-component system, OmpR family, phosphate regulon sensor histidine kinase PhoR
VRRHIIVRVLAGYVVLSLIALGAFAIYSVSLARRLSFDALTRGLTATARTALVAVQPLMAGGRAPQLDTLVAGMGTQGGVRITVIDKTGIVLADSQDNPSTMENHSLRPEVAEALAGRVGSSWRLSNTERTWMIYVAVPVPANGGVIRAASYPKELDAAVSRTEGSIVVFGSLLFLACVLSALVLSRSITAPLSDLSDVVKRFASGDFAARLHLRRRDEIRTLADTFNMMGERVQQLFLERAQRTQELDSIFTSVQQGIVVLDGDGRIVRSNNGFAELAGDRPVEGKTLWEVLRAPRLTELVQAARASGARQAEEVGVGERTVLCAVERMGGRGELILFLSDTTDLRRLEAVKRDFVVNASHELRTPLTSIVGSLEMLEGKVRGDDERWVEAIRRNADRMAAIVQDMLLLSRLEARGAEPSPAPVDLARLVRDVAGMVAHRAETQGLTLSVSVEAGVPPLEADGFLLEQMLVNLVDNALKYTEKGSVEIRLAAENGSIRIEVRDSGIGIPPESLPRIFERFYVVDKSRSRKLGGTGLGLAIVKHIVNVHRGTIDVESTPGQGTRFVVRLPRAGN